MGVNGTRAAEFKTFAQTNWEVLARSAVLLSGNPSDVDDLLQETFERLWRSWPRVRPESALAYARTVMVNARNDQWRRATRTPVPHDPEQLERAASESGYAAVDDRLAILDQLATLDERERLVVVAHWYWGMGYPQIAELASMPVGTAKSLASRALAKLKLAREGERHA